MRLTHMRRHPHKIQMNGASQLSVIGQVNSGYSTHTLPRAAAFRSTGNTFSFVLNGIVFTMEKEI